LGEDAVPSDLIASDLYQGEAERWLLGLDPLAATRVGDEQEAVFRSIILRIAALLSPRLPQARQINMAGHTATFTFGETVTERTARLLTESVSALVLFLPLVEVVDSAFSPAFVTTVSGRRA
jgi:hypothetical protein